MMHIDVDIRPPEASANRPRALAVNGDATARNVHRRLLSLCGLDAEVAADGLGAIHALSRAQAIRDPFDLILMDVATPVVDGWVAASTVRRNGYAGRIVIVGRYSDSTTVSRCDSCGVDYFLLNPTTAEILNSLIRACAGIPHPRLRRTHFGPARALAGLACA